MSESTMVFQHIEKLKREYTDKYVVVDDSQPELLRFKNQTGVVRTVNMSGKALVEFDAFENIGWYDIDVDFLKIIDKPLPKEEPAKKPAAKKPAAKAADAKPATGGKMSVADMLAAARAEKGGSPAKTAEKPAAKQEAEPASGADAKKMSVAEMLAAARAEKSGGEEGEGGVAAEVAEPETEPEPAADEPAAAKAEKPDIPNDVPGIIAYCRKVDG